MPSPWDDFWPKFWLIVIDKALLGVAVAGVGYVLQRLLEVFKRDQSLASEVAKARIAAFHRVFAAAAALDAANNRLWEAMKEAATAPPPVRIAEHEDVVSRAVDLKSKVDTLYDLIETERFLLGDEFVRAARKFVREIGEALPSVVRALDADQPPIDAEHEQRRAERRRLLKALVLCVPRYARFPDKDPHFASPDFDTVYAEITKKEQQRLKK